MTRPWGRRAVVAVATLVCGQLLPLGAARASGSCGHATPFVGVAAGTIEMFEWADWWQTTTVSRTTVTVQSTVVYDYLGVYDAYCGELCWNSTGTTLECQLPQSGTFYVVVGDFYGTDVNDYTVTALPVVSAG